MRLYHPLKLNNTNKLLYDGVIVIIQSPCILSTSFCHFDKDFRETLQPGVFQGKNSLGDLILAHA